jgi:hypothetical protein
MGLYGKSSTSVTCGAQHVRRRARAPDRGKQTMRGSPFGEVAPLVAWHVSLVLCGRDLARTHFIGLWGQLAQNVAPP